MTPAYIIRRSIERGFAALRRKGLDFSRIETPASKGAGFAVQWRRDPAGVTRGAVVETREQGRLVRFFVDDNSDLIQRYHLNGSFYEAEALAMMAPYFKGGLFVDAGANVGNHSVYAALILGADRVIAFEPNPPALRVLEINIALNGLADRVTVHPVGLADKPGRAKLHHVPGGNLGGVSLAVGDQGEFEIVAGDTLLAGEPVAFIKIDTEGLEMQVLAGMAETIRRCRPGIFVEVEDVQIPAFESWCAEFGYRVEKSYKPYAVNTNFLVIPNDAAPAPAKGRARKKTGE